MSDMSDLSCLCCSGPIERLRFFSGQLLTAHDMLTEQSYAIEKRRRHNRYLHGWGVVCGCTVEAVPDAKEWQVRVCPGYVVSPQGDEILIDDCVDVPLKTGTPEPPCSVRWPCPPLGEMPSGAERRRNVYIAVRYAECYSRPVRVHPAGCGCDETGCEYSRIRDSFEIKVLWELPASHVEAVQDDNQWCTTIRNTPAEQLTRRHTFPVPPCPECVVDPWVVLATVILPATNTAAPTAATGALTVSYSDRRVLLGTQRLQTAVLCVP